MREDEALALGAQILESAHLLIVQHIIVFGLIDGDWLHELLAYDNA
tara:strand:- start:1475 stop:1612 length:138 start_codon:yes stop_codon:yes gene_type:complete